MSGPFTFRFSRLVGRQKYSEAIDYLRSGLKGDASDLSSLEMIAYCHRWADETDEAIAACHEALRHDPKLFDMHAMLSQLLAEKGEHENAAIHARQGLECYPEPLLGPPRFIDAAHSFFSRIFPRLRDIPSPSEAFILAEAEHTKWYDWAKKYLNWYDTTYGGTTHPRQH